MDTVKRIIIRDIRECTLKERVQMKQLEINNYQRIISRRDNLISEYNKLGRVCDFLIASTNKLRRELTVARAELRQLKRGIVLN